ncbi:MAG: phospholipase D family protein [Actinomycetota bacterium]|nr:phospholipase D family protein [Actinomycetota bacterium]
MLQPTNRLTLIDAMRPPHGFDLDAAMAVTFTLDLRALLAAPAAFALAGTQAAGESPGQGEPIELLHALRAHARKLTVFSQVGEIALPPSRRVFTFLERAVIPVRAPRGGVVHPKVWVLSYRGPIDGEAGASERRLRVLVASRNLTFDASWDTVVRLDESADGTGADLNAVGFLFEGLMEHAAGPVAAEHAERVESLLAALKTARLALPAGVDEINLTTLGLDATPSPLPVEADRSLVISPFLSDDFFTRVRPAAIDELVSRPESIDLLPKSSRQRIETIYAFDDGGAFELRPAEERLSPRDPGRPLVGLHAKVFAFERGDRAHLFLGSANATAAAFTSNVEILVELVGSRRAIGIDRLCGGTEDEVGLRSLFVHYGDEASPISEGAAPSSLDRARHKIAGIPVEGVVEESGSGWAVTYRTRSPLPEIGGTTIECWPLTSSGNRRPVPGGQRLEARFETALESISGFLAFKLTEAAGTETAFVVPVELVGLPEARDRLLLRALIGNADRFLRYLLALLDDDPTGVELLDLVEGTEHGHDREAVRAGSIPVLEKLLHTMRRDPAKLAALHPLVTDLARDDALPEGFAELWAMIHEAALTGDGAL